MRKLFKLSESGESRIGADAVDNEKRRFELKSGTTKSTTTARDVGLHTLEKWLGKHWLIGFGEKKSGQFQFNEIFYLSPEDMKPFCDRIREKIQPDLDLLKKVKTALGDRVSDEERSRLEYLVNRGYTLNNPKIPYAYVEANGTKLTKFNAKTLKKAIQDKLNSVS